MEKIKVFVAGGISNCPDWQAEFVGMFDKNTFEMLNPRKKHFNANDRDAARAQIEWEHAKLREADIIAFWFPQESVCPITLFELGVWLAEDDGRGKKPVFVGVHPAYPRRFDVEEQIRLTRRYTTHVDEIVYNLKDLAELVQTEAALMEAEDPTPRRTNVRAKHVRNTFQGGRVHTSVDGGPTSVGDGAGLQKGDVVVNDFKRAKRGQIIPVQKNTSGTVVNNF